MKVVTLTISVSVFDEKAAIDRARTILARDGLTPDEIEKLVPDNNVAAAMGEIFAPDFAIESGFEVVEKTIELSEA